MAVPAEIPAQADETAGLPEVLDKREALRKHCAKLYGLGFQRAEIARALVDYLAPDRDKPMEQRLHRARGTLRRYETQDSFRDMVFESAKIQLDMAGPAILKGIAKQAKRGRVDAARLAFEITGRHTAKGDTQPTQVAVVIGGIPRPQSTAAQIVDYTDEDQDDGSE